MVAIAKKDYSALRFQVGSMRALAQEKGTLGRITAWYSTIHIPPARLPATFKEFSRVLVEGGYLALAFQVECEQVHFEQGYGHSVSLDAYRFDPNEIADPPASTGLIVRARLVRQPDASEKVSQAYLLAQRAPD
jgi:hypothetical protein